LPITPGFRAESAQHVVVLFRDPPGLRVPIASVEAALLRLQVAVGLQFISPARFVLCDSWSDFARFTPWLRVSHGMGAITLPIGLLTYVTPTVRARDDLLDFMTHEAAHSLLYQHASIRSRLEMERQAWLVEGVAVHFGNPASYPSLTELARVGSSADVVSVIDAPDDRSRRSVGGTSFSYSAYGHFIGHLIERFGADRFRLFVADYLKNPAAYRDDFQRVFGVRFSDAARMFSGQQPSQRR